MRLNPVLSLIYFCVLVHAGDYYEILGLGRDASERDIKKAYRNLSKKYHPDKNQGDEDAHHKFIEIGEAYDVLSDNDKKQIYDEHGEEGLKHGGAPPQNEGFNFFQHMFGGQQQQHQGKRRGNTAQTSMEASLKDFYNGAGREFSLEMQNVCGHCKGSGSEDGKNHRCDECNGSGVRIMKMQIAPGMFQQIQQHCPKCQGQGKVISNHCHECQGQGVVRKVREYSFHLEPGAPRDHQEVFEKEGDQHPDIIPGDLVMKVREASLGNLGYRRRHNDLYRDEVLTLKEALFGDWNREIGFLDDDENLLTLSRAKGEIVVDGEIEILKGKGMPLKDGADEFGDLYIQYKIIYPGGGKKLAESLRDEL